MSAGYEAELCYHLWTHSPACPDSGTCQDCIPKDWSLAIQCQPGDQEDDGPKPQDIPTGPPSTSTAKSCSRLDILHVPLS